MKVAFKLRHLFNVNPAQIYAAWLDSVQHSRMTGGQAECSDTIGGSFTAWGGYIEGKNIALKPNKEIRQSWRTSEFDANDEDSIVTVQFNASENGTELVLEHNNIPEGQTQYKKGWLEHYFIPMENYFNSLEKDPG